MSHRLLGRCNGDALVLDKGGVSRRALLLLLLLGLVVLLVLLRLLLVLVVVLVVLGVRVVLVMMERRTAAWASGTATVFG